MLKFYLSQRYVDVATVDVGVTDVDVGVGVDAEG